MNKKRIEQINVKALKLNNSFSVIEDKNNECLITHISNIGKKRYLEYKQIPENEVLVSIYDAMKDDMELKKAAEFICSFNANDVLEGFYENTIGFSGEINKSQFIKTV